MKYTFPKESHLYTYFLLCGQCGSFPFNPHSRNLYTATIGTDSQIIENSIFRARFLSRFYLYPYFACFFSKQASAELSFRLEIYEREKYAKSTNEIIWKESFFACLLHARACISRREDRILFFATFGSYYVCIPALH